MASTRRKTKHRGNAAGVVESRGRTGRKPTAEEKKGATGQSAKARQKPRDRRDEPPTWGGAFIRAMFAGVIVLALLIVLKIGSSQGDALLFVVALAFYTPISYYTENWAFRRRQRNKQRDSAQGRGAAR